MGTRDISRSSLKQAHLSRAAVDFTDCLLGAQRQRFERERAAMTTGRIHRENPPARPRTFEALAEGEAFLGTGWSDLQTGLRGTPYRWMKRLGTLMLPVMLEHGAHIEIHGYGIQRGLFLKGASLFVDDCPVDGKFRRLGLRRWHFQGQIPALPDQGLPCAILRLQAPGLKMLPGSGDRHASLGVSRVKVTGD